MGVGGQNRTFQARGSSTNKQIKGQGRSNLERDHEFADSP